MPRINTTYPIHWHYQCLQNMRQSLATAETQLARMTADVERHRAQVAFYTEQIADAERRGMAAFDRDRLLIKQRKSGSGDGS